VLNDLGLSQETGRVPYDSALAKENVGVPNDLGLSQESVRARCSRCLGQERDLVQDNWELPKEPVDLGQDQRRGPGWFGRTSSLMARVTVTERPPSASLLPRVV
jgi:hypothetical protein